MAEIDDGKLAILAKTAEYAFSLEAVAKEYYEQHRASGCICEICKRAEQAFASITHAGPGRELKGGDRSDS
jgi:hypothetical protein